MIFGQNLGRQTEKAKQGILRYIWDRKLREGDKILKLNGKTFNATGRAAGPVDRRGRAAARHAAHVQLEHGLRPSERTAEERLPVYDVPVPRRLPEPARAGNGTPVPAAFRAIQA